MIWILIVNLSRLTSALNFFGDFNYLQVSQKKLEVNNLLFSNITASVDKTYATISTSHKLKTKCRAAVIFCSSTLCFYSDCDDENGNILCKVRPPLQGSYDEFAYTYTLIMILPYYHVIGSEPIYFEENYTAPMDTDINFVSTSVKTLPGHLLNSSLHDFSRNSMSTNGDVTNYFNWRYSEKYNVGRFNRQIQIIGDLETKFEKKRYFVSLPSTGS